MPRTPASRRRKAVNKGPNANPAKPLSTVPREMFAQLIAKGVNAESAYHQAGYQGQAITRRELRASRDVDSRVNWLLEERIRSEAKARHKREKPHVDLKQRVIDELTNLAFSDAREIVQWRKRAKMDEDGNVVDFVNEVDVTPSHMLTPQAASMVRRVTRKGGDLQFEAYDKVQALEKLAKVLGIYQDVGPSIVTQNNTLNQVNIGSDNALEAVRRLAFAIHKAQHSQALSDPLMIEHAPDALPKR